MPGVGHTGEAQTLDVTLGGVSYEIELGARHRPVYDKLHARCAESGRIVSARSGKPRPVRSSSLDNAVVRAWAANNGVKCSPSP
jgi:hypothetical protein